MALTKKDQELIAHIAAQAAMAAVAAMGGGKPAADPASAGPVEELPEDKADEEAARRSEQEERDKIAAVEGLATELLPHILQPRHEEVFHWMTGNKPNAEALRAIIRQAVAANTANYREATRGYSGSTKNVATLETLRGNS